MKYTLEYKNKGYEYILKVWIYENIINFDINERIANGETVCEKIKCHLDSRYIIWLNDMAIKRKQNV